FEHVGHDEERRVRRKLRAPIFRDDAKRGAILDRRRHEVVAVAVVALDGEEGFVRADAAAVDGNAEHALGQRAFAPRAHGRGRGLAFNGPYRLSLHAAPFIAAATASWSLNGRTLSPMIWPVSWPLPAISSTSPDCSSDTAVLIASPRSPISRAPRAAARISAR